MYIACLENRGLFVGWEGGVLMLSRNTCVYWEIVHDRQGLL